MTNENLHSEARLQLLEMEKRSLSAVKNKKKVN